jgi:hypothetical protein
MISYGKTHDIPCIYGYLATIIVLEESLDIKDGARITFHAGVEDIYQFRWEARSVLNESFGLAFDTAKEQRSQG